MVNGIENVDSTIQIFIFVSDLSKLNMFNFDQSKSASSVKKVNGKW